MRDLSNPLAPSIFKGEGRKRRQAKRTAKIASNNEKMEANKNKTKTVGKNTGFSVVNTFASCLIIFRLHFPAKAH